MFPLERNLMFVSVSSNLLAIHFCSQMSMSIAMAAMFAMLIPTVTTQVVLIFVLARKDKLEMDSHVKVSENTIETSSFAHKQSLREISSHFRGLFLRTTLVFLYDYFLYVNYASRYRWMQQWKPWLWRKCELYKH